MSDSRIIGNFCVHCICWFVCLPGFETGPGSLEPHCGGRAALKPTETQPLGCWDQKPVPPLQAGLCTHLKVGPSSGRSAFEAQNNPGILQCFFLRQFLWVLRELSWLSWNLEICLPLPSQERKRPLVMSVTELFCFLAGTMLVISGSRECSGPI